MWRFELIVTNPRKRPETGLQDVPLLNHTFAVNLNLAKILANRGQFEASLLLALTVWEVKSQKILRREGKSPDRLSTVATLKTIYSLGFMNRQSYNFLYHCYIARNRIAHGYKGKLLTRTPLQRLFNAIESIDKETVEDSE